MFLGRALVWAALAFAWTAGAQVRFSEIHYHPIEKPEFREDGLPALDLTDDVHEFIELHNASSAPVSLGQWELSGGVDYVFPEGTVIPAGGFVVIAGQPERVAAVYGLAAGQVLGPWHGHLSNRRERLELVNSAEVRQDEVEYRTESPWAIAADALGADDEWTGLNSRDYQYRGRSLERVSYSHPSDDPANWLASPLAPGPSPGRSNAVQREVPLPIVLTRDVRQRPDGSEVIRAGNPVWVECGFSAGAGIGNVRLEWYREDLNTLLKPTTAQPMWPVGSGLDARFQAEVPAQTNRTIVRYRIWANRGTGDEVVSPRADDPIRWHAWYTSPQRATTTNAVYDVFISRKSLDILRTNISGTPRRVTLPDPPGLIRASWNATQPALFVAEGRVYEVQMRHHGSQFRRDVSRSSYKIQFPAYAKFLGRDSLFLTDKDYRTYAGHTVFRAAGLPTPRTWWIDLYLNTNARLQRLAQEEYDLDLLERYHQEQAAERGLSDPEPAGEFYKSQGIFDAALGPYGAGNGLALGPRLNKGTNAWTPRQRYEWIYTQQMHGWKGHVAFESMLNAHWEARQKTTAAPSAAVLPKLRSYFSQAWDVDKALTHVALVNWQGVWDDTMHNYYLWQQANGRWSMLPWDFDDQFNAQGTSVSIFNGAPFAGPNYFKQSLVAAYRDQFRTNAWWLNNTLLDPDNLPGLGISSLIRTWAVGRQRAVNSQLGLGFFARPHRPTNSAGLNPLERSLGQFLAAPPYAYNTNPVVAQAATVWQFRETNRSWLEPVLTRTNPLPDTSFALTEDQFQWGRTYAWRVQHVDGNGHPSPWSAEALVRFGEDPAGAIRLNEVLALNQGIVPHGGAFPDYLELVNRSEAAVNVGGWAVSDDPGRPGRYVIPSGTVIPAGGFLVLWCDDRTAAPGLHTGFGLGRLGETLSVFSPGPSGWVLVDRLIFGIQLPDLAVGRGPNQLWTLVSPTPGATNAPVELADGSEVRINEWLASGPGIDDWVELFHAGTRPVNLGGLVFTDGVVRSPVTPLTFMAPNGFQTFQADASPDQGSEHLGFKLPLQGGMIALQRTNGVLIDRVFYPRQVAGITLGRVPDGSDWIYPLPTASSGRSNRVDGDGDGLPDVWEQLHQLNPVLADATADADADGFTNEEEFRWGTNPRDAASRWSLAVRLGAPDALVFLATPGRRYQVQQLAPDGSTWSDMKEVLPSPATREVQIPLSLASPSAGGLFRVVAD
ncbi:MAG: lamin tail domain-containing protein [Verrucomicrobia bacterium]|nr:lamin tail domain-containing protein [Verrucomicrobiota bacterium]